MDEAARTSGTGWRLAAALIAYFVATVGAVALTRFEGGVACVWIASSVLLATLDSSELRRWPAVVLASAAVGMFATALWGIGWAAAPLMALINVSEPVIAAILLRHWRIRRSGMDSLRSLGLFVLAAGIVSPASAGLPGALVVSAVSETDFAANYGRWFLAHGLGTLTFTPIFALIASGELKSWFQSVRRVEIVEALFLVGLTAVVTLGVFTQTSLPILFLPVLPLMIVTFRLGRMGAATALVIIAVIGGWLTLGGFGPVTLMKGSNASHIQFFQFYLSVTVMTVLPVAADLTRRGRLFEQLQDSEARFRLLTENSTDIVVNLHPDGTVRYVSPSIAQLGDYHPDALLGRSVIDLIAPDDRDDVRRAHAQALGHPGETFAVEFRVVVEGEDRWFEANTRAILDGAGAASGLVSAIRETSARKRTEAELSLAANTDPLTGLCNRRAFDRSLAALLARKGGGCVAMLDLDHFKRINDTFGHAVGDDMLKAFAAAAAAHIRTGDVFARIGGEEFGLILPDVPARIAAAACERIRLSVAAINMRADGWPVRVTVSIGIAPIHADTPPDDILRQADKALYEAKTLGRNRYSLAA